MDSNSNSDVASEKDGVVELENEIWDVNDLVRCGEILRENMVIENRLKEEVEMKDRECNSLAFELEELKKQHTLAERTANALRKSLLEKQMDMENISLEIKKQEELIASQSLTNSPEYYVESLHLVSQMMDHVENYRNAMLCMQNEFQERNQLIDEKMNILKKLFCSVKSFKPERDRIQKEVESEIRTFELHIHFPHFEINLRLLQDEFNRYKRTEEIYSDLVVKKKGIDAENEDVQTACAFLEKRIQNLNEQYKNIAAYFESESIAIEQEIHIMDTNCPKMICDLEEQINKLGQLFEILSTNCNNLECECKDQITHEASVSSSLDESLNSSEKLKKKNEELEEKTIKMSEKLESSTQIIKNMEKERVSKESEIAMFRNRILCLKEDIANFKQENKDILSEDSENLENNPILFQDRQTLNDFVSRNSHLEMELSSVQKEISELSIQKNLQLDHLQRFKKFINDLEIIESKKKNKLAENLAKESEQMHAQIDSYRDYIGDLFVASFEEQLFIDSLTGDILTAEEDIIPAHKELWAASKENDDNAAELQRLKKMLEDDQRTLNMLKKLYSDLKKNSIPVNRIPQEWYDSMGKLKNEYESVLMERRKLEKQKNSFEQLHNDKSHSESKSDFETTISDFESLKLSDMKSKRKLNYDIFKEKVKKVVPGTP